MNEQKLRNKMASKISGYNKFLDASYINGLSTQAVINNTHPLSREKYQDAFDKLEAN